MDNSNDLDEPMQFHFDLADCREAKGAEPEGESPRGSMVQDAELLFWVCIMVAAVASVAITFWTF